MSLLIKALEKAAKDHQENAPTNNVAPAAQDLTLEPMTQASSAATTPASSRTTENETPAPIASEPAFSSERAATIVNVNRKRENAGLAWARGNPRALFFSLVGLFVAGYGTYLYLQITHPGWFIRKAPAPIAATPAPAPIIVTSAPRTEVAPPKPLTDTQAAPQPHVPHKTTHKTPAPPATTAPATDNDNSIAAAPDNVTPAPTLDGDLQAAYAALNAGDLTTAQQRYSDLQTRAPNNPDVWLGLAAIAAQQGDVGTATRDYMKTLTLDPHNAPAQAGLLNLLGAADPAAAETRLKQLITQTPSPFLYFTLGNTYADQNRWAEAQSAYFEAYNRRPDNPDYAYNLAVALEHINQPALAANFYKRALALTSAPTHPAHFDTATAQARLQKLSSLTSVNTQQ